MHDSPFCFWHSPEHVEEAAKARSLGGQRRRRESTLVGAYHMEPLDTVRGVRRVLEIATFDALGMEQSANRIRLLISAATVAGRLLQAADLEQQVKEILAILKPRDQRKGRR
ncbi:MAG: hypothetical protein WEB52_13660 [Dehalococcoidia bacterium]